VIDVKSERNGERTAVEVVMRGPQHLHDKAKLALLRSTGAYKLSVEE
jgi:hypothetical protein